MEERCLGPHESFLKLLCAISLWRVNAWQNSFLGAGFPLCELKSIT